MKRISQKTLDENFRAIFDKIIKQFWNRDK